MDINISNYIIDALTVLGVAYGAGITIYSIKNHKKWNEDHLKRDITNSIKCLQGSYEKRPDLFTDNKLQGIKKLYDTIEDKIR